MAWQGAAELGSQKPPGEGCEFYKKSLIASTTNRIFFKGWNQYSTGIWSRRRTTKWLSEADSTVRITPARPQRQGELVPVALP
jgi:hypothetical protein